VPTRRLALRHAATWSLASLWLACGGGSDPHGARAPVDPCQDGDLGACVAAAGARCVAGQAWRLPFKDLPPLAVAAGGALRLDHLGGELFAADATRFAACFADCPGGGGERICFPLELPVRLAWERKPECVVATGKSEPWNGRPSRLEVETSCGGAQLQSVPDLAPAQRALIDAGVITADDVLAKATGLVVSAGPPAAPTVRLESIEPAACQAFALPAGYRLALGKDDVAALAELSAAPARAAEQQSRALLAEGGATAMAAARAEVLDWVAANHADRCRSAGLDPADRAALERCAATMPETEARFDESVARAVQDERRRRQAELDAITVRELVGPLCRAYARRAR
jgi:hypothetical protein